MILVTGATGRVGSEVVRALHERGERVRAFVRDPDRARAMLGERIELAVGDLADDRTVGAALAGADAVVLSCADDPRRVAWETRLVDRAAGAGVRRIVRLSTAAAAPGAPVAFWDWHGRVDDHLRAADVPSVLLRSSFSMSNLLADAASVARDGRIYAPAGSARIAMIDPRDVGDAAAAALAAPGHDGRTYVLTGPEAITYERVAETLAGALGRDVAFVDVPPDAAREAMLAAGLPAFVADQVVAIFAALRAGVAEHVTGDVEALTGRPPRALADFARDHAGRFAPAAV